MSDTMPIPTIGVTCGDPAGIGLETLFKAVARSGLASRVRLILYAAPNHLSRCIQDLTGEPKALAQSWLAAPSDDRANRTLRPLEAPGGDPPVGHFDPAWGRVARDALERSADDAIGGRLDAVVTLPIVKTILADAHFPGQTEFFAARTGTPSFAMMLAGEQLRVVPVTTHVALRDVAEQLTTTVILERIEVTWRALKSDFGIANPRLAVCGLNPHAGEGGAMGNEEKSVIQPAVEAARAAGINVEGPVAADSLFHRAVQEGLDAVVCMYHDQGLIPFKLLHFNDGVNVTVGLPIVRTSPDHGVAYDIAGGNRANPGSTEAALHLAIELANRRSLCQR